jgi:hypothetical protein
VVAWVILAVNTSAVAQRLRGLARRPGREWWRAAHRMERLVARSARKRLMVALGKGTIGSLYGVSWLVSKPRRYRRRPTRGPEPWRRLPR